MTTRYARYDFFKIKHAYTQIVKIQWNCCIQNWYLLLTISLVDAHDPTATPTLDDPNCTIQSNINITGLFYIIHTQLLIGVISNITSVMNIHDPATTPTVRDPWLYSPEQYKHCQIVKNLPLHTAINFHYYTISQYQW